MLLNLGVPGVFSLGYFPALAAGTHVANSVIIAYLVLISSQNLNFENF